MNVTAYVEEISRNLLAMFRLMSRVAHFLNSKATGRELFGGILLLRNFSYLPSLSHPQKLMSNNGPHQQIC